jgi:carboxylesterase type B
VLFLYGGRWSDGDKSQYRFVAQALVSKALIASPPTIVFIPMSDSRPLSKITKAVRWTREHIAEHGRNASCVYLMGHSAGVHTAAILALDER